MIRTTAIPLVFLIACSGANKELAEEKEMPPPTAMKPEQPEANTGETRREVVTEELFGHPIRDPYRWLEDASQDEVKTWMTDENAKARKYLDGLPEREALAARLKELIYVEARGAPVERGGRLFYWKKGADQEKAVHFVKLPKQTEKVLLDPNEMSTDGSVSIGDVVPSHDGKLVAYMLKANNADESDLHVMETDSKKEIDLLPGLRYTTPSWTPDGKGFFYTWIPKDSTIAETDRMGYAEIRYHRIGDDVAKDEVFREKTGDPRKWQGANVSEDGKYLFATIAYGWSEMDVYVMSLKDKARTWLPLAVGTKATYSVDEYKDVFYVATDDEAPKKRVFSVNPKKLERKDWKLIIPEDPNAVINEIAIVGKKLAILYLENASSKLEVFELSGKKVRTVPLPEIGTATTLIGRQESDTAYFLFSSYTIPWEVHETSVKTGKTSLFAKPDVPIDPSGLEVKQVWYPSKDGTKISMFIVAKKGLPLDGDNPTLLYGYGGFNISLTPGFNPMLIPWLERGGVYAVPNLRGGGEYGEAWHQAGMGKNKQNVFDDFIAAAEFLIHEKYTSRPHLAIEGRSNGGLLVGAAITQRPDLYAAVICGVPLLDMVRYHLVGIGKAWIPEYGSPEVKEELETLLAYSPYHHVKEGTEYPALLMLSADSDDRVDPMHARKFHAAIGHASRSGQPNLLRIEMHSGHGGADLRRSFLDQSVDELSFLLSETQKPAQGGAQARR